MAVWVEHFTYHSVDLIDCQGDVGGLEASAEHAACPSVHGHRLAEVKTMITQTSSNLLDM
jgi:hypothetical protein